MKQKEIKKYLAITEWLQFCHSKPKTCLSNMDVNNEESVSTETTRAIA